jgi:hypothetical protein
LVHGVRELERILRGTRKARGMNNDFSLQSPESLMLEVERYLTAVETFRALDCEPTWHPELTVDPSTLARRLAAYAEAAPQPAH